MRNIRGFNKRCWFCRKNPEVSTYFVPDPESDVKVGACEECDKEIQKAGGYLTYDLFSKLKQKHLHDRLANRKE